MFVPYSAAQDENSYTISEDSSPTANDILKWDEVFTYKVKYSFFTLGNVRVEITDTLYNGKPAWLLTGIITSNPGIPFVGKEENHYNSIFRVVDGEPRELVYWKDDIDSDELNEERYVYDYENEKVYAFEKGEATDTLDLHTPATSGPLIFLYSRMHAGEVGSYRTYIYLEDQQGKIDMTYTHKMDERDYDAFDNPVSTFYVEGDADLDGPFGFGGSFKAWYADDELRLPLEAHLKVWLGNVKVILIDYKKELRK